PCHRIPSSHNTTSRPTLLQSESPSKHPGAGENRHVQRGEPGGKARSCRTARHLCPGTCLLLWRRQISRRDETVCVHPAAANSESSRPGSLRSRRGGERQEGFARFFS